MKRMGLLSAALAALLVAPMAWAQVGAGDEPGAMGMEKGAAMKGDMGKRMAKRLGLTADQEKQIDAIRAEQREAMKPLREKQAAQIKELKDLLDKKAGDRELTNALDGIEATRKTIQDTAKKYMEKHDAVLTPTQRAKAVVGMGKGYRECAKAKAGPHKECPFAKDAKKAD